MKRRIDILIGGPAHGRKFPVPESQRYRIHVASCRAGYVDANWPSLPVCDEVYVRQSFALGDERGLPVRVADFWAHENLTSQRAAELLWDHLMELAGAGP